MRCGWEARAALAEGYRVNYYSTRRARRSEEPRRVGRGENNNVREKKKKEIQKYADLAQEVRRL